MRNKFLEIEEPIINTDSSVFLRKNRYEIMSNDSNLFDNIERKHDQADQLAESSSERLSKDEIFDRVRTRIDGREKL